MNEALPTATTETEKPKQDEAPAVTIDSLFGLKQETFPVKIAGMTFHVAFMHQGANSKYSEKLAALSKPHRKAIAKGKLKPEVDKQLGVEAFCSTILVGWEDVVVSEGQPPVKYNFANAVSVMKGYPLLYEKLITEASDSDNFTEILEGDQEGDEALGNG